MKKILYVITALFIIAGIIITATVGLRYNYDIKGGEKLRIHIGREFEIKDIENMAKEAFNMPVQVEIIDLLEEAVAITADEISDENLDEIIAKLNEEYETDEYKKENVSVIHIPNVRMRDLVSSYIAPLIIATVVTLGYVIFISKHKIRDPLIMIVGIILSALLLLSDLAVFRIIIDKSILMSGVITYILTILFILTETIKEGEQGTRDNLIVAAVCFLSSIGTVIVGIVANKNILVSSGMELMLGVLLAFYISLCITLYKDSCKEIELKR